MHPSQLSFFDRNDREQNLFDRSQITKSSNFSITKTINAPVHAVFDQWLIPIFIGGWMFDPKIQKESIISLENKVRKGGEFKFLVDRKGQKIIITGRILELEIPEHLAFSWIESPHTKAESQISVKFNPMNGKTKIKLTAKLPAVLSEHIKDTKKIWAARLTLLGGRFK
ncbi:MAG: hypothetical protein CMQ41_00375 [Gammaproteobacteria bacterium]|nr:hypothetical protein [Gammaproteobacteria bacterium]|tara:strand:- start:559 stop:1065 length:507 start_codon:yes stop_codon:yes gene_type:complete